MHTTWKQAIARAAVYLRGPCVWAKRGNSLDAHAVLASLSLTSFLTLRCGHPSRSRPLLFSFLVKIQVTQHNTCSQIIVVTDTVVFGRIWKTSPQAQTQITPGEAQIHFVESTSLTECSQLGMCATPIRVGIHVELSLSIVDIVVSLVKRQ